MGRHSLLFNYISLLGPLFGTAIFILAGMLSFDSLWGSLLPPALYFGIHLLEGEALTPTLLARRFTNPVLVILSLVFWFWVWGVPGAKGPWAFSRRGIEQVAGRPFQAAGDHCWAFRNARSADKGPRVRSNLGWHTPRRIALRSCRSALPNTGVTRHCE